MDLVTDVFSSGEAFLSSPRLFGTCCIIADVQMPGMTGAELQQELKKKGVSAPMIFITGYPSASVRAAVLDAGALEYLVKPFDGREIVDCVRRALHLPEG
jgi:FixJ family two-component response regulator